uniref:Transcriptional regulator n=1 Tax=Steinernema glaseri TaxID=37863 RepID=A0A1I7YGG5_9BILA
AGNSHGVVLRADQGKQVFPRHELHPGQAAQLLAEARGERGVGVDPGAHRSAALGQGLQAWQSVVQVTDARLDLCRPAAQHLAHAHGHGVHQVGATGLDERVHLLGLVLDHLHQVLERRQQLFVQGQRGAHVDGGGDDVVAALAAVDMVIGVYRVAHHTAGQGRDHLVGIHVGAGAGAGLGEGLPALAVLAAVELAQLQQRLPGLVQAQAAPMPRQHAVARGVEQQAEGSQGDGPGRGLGAADQVATFGQVVFDQARLVGLEGTAN